MIPNRKTLYDRFFPNAFQVIIFKQYMQCTEKNQAYSMHFKIRKIMILLDIYAKKLRYWTNVCTFNALIIITK